MGAALASPLLGSVISSAGSVMSGAMGGGGGGGGGSVEAKPEPAAPAKTADVLKEAKTSSETLTGKKKNLSGLRIKRSALGGGTGSGLNA